MTTESYCEHFNLKEKPFSLAADPRYLYMSEQHWEAMAHLMYGIDEDWGFVLVTGEIGAGKTTLCRLLLEQMPAEVEVAFIANPKVNARELLISICEEFRIPYAPGGQSVKELFDLLSLHLMEVHARARKTLLIIDEAQYLSTNVLDLLRLLTNLETEACKLLRIILIGQPELRTKLARPELEQMSQRITARYHLGPLSKKEISSYIDHRMTTAGATEKHFTASAISLLYRMSGGVPRLINVIADRALLGAYMKREQVVTRSTLKQAAREVLRDAKFRSRSPRMTTAAWAASGLLLAVISVFLGLFLAEHPLRELLLRPSGGGQPAARDKGVAGMSWLPAGLSTAGSRGSAYNAILGHKGISYYTSDSATDDTFCTNMEILDLRCLNRKDPERRLETVPVPAVLTLADRSHNIFYAALISLKNDRASIRIGDKDTEVTLAELKGLWSGEYMTLENSVKPAGKEIAAAPKNKSSRNKGK
ncbi:MAG: peptidoglycan-binding protein [Thermodesulfovibrio sp.]|nr:peptidoglycan-binding protein [Thermodesulfovibrio sp.]